MYRLFTNYVDATAAVRPQKGTFRNERKGTERRLMEMEMADKLIRGNEDGKQTRKFKNPNCKNMHLAGM